MGHADEEVVVQRLAGRGRALLEGAATTVAPARRRASTSLARGVSSM
ncbi:MAG: hypothetical protein H6710_07260 [Myxococcales bacterium]|nr:hypothetical protein [Myxococcales bacterium]